ncbi:MAG: nucleotide exchange factor GrpE [bacterium]|nr:nucleotide exchange factor GrpE [bacterium]
MPEETQMTLEGALAEIDTLKTRLDVCQKQSEEHLDGWKRAKADYINFKNEQDKRSKEFAQFASMATLMQCLPVVENFRKAFNHVPESLKDSDWVKGIEHIYRQMKEMLKVMGVEEYTGLVGQPFNPEKHQAVGQEQRDDFEDEIVSQEIEAGYSLHGKVMQPAKVIVNKKPSQL